MRRKDFFKWSFGLRFLFVFLCALMCVRNAWGANYSTRLIMNTATHGKVWMTTNSTSLPTQSNLRYTLTGSNADKNRTSSTANGDTYYYVFAKPDDGYKFDGFSVVGEVSCDGSCEFGEKTDIIVKNTTDVTAYKVIVTMKNPNESSDLLMNDYATAHIVANFSLDASTVDVTYSVDVVNESNQATTLGDGVTIAYTANCSDYNYSYNYLTEASVEKETTAETDVTLSMPYKAAPDNAYLNLPRGYNFKGWYKGGTQVSQNPVCTTAVTANTTIAPRIEKKATRSVTIDSPTHGSLTVADIEDANKSTISNKATLIASNPMSIYKDDKLTFIATPAEGYYFYRWYYRKNNATRVTFEPSSNTFTLPDNGNATAIGVEFKQRKEFKVSYKDAVFTNTDYTLYAGGLLNPAANAEDVTRTLYEGESINLSFIIAPGTTRGVRFNGWYYTISESEDKHHIGLAQHTLNTGTGAIYYTLTYETLAGILAQNPGKTVTFAVDVEKKATRNITFVSNPNGSYHGSFLDANGNSDEHTSTTNSHGTFKVARKSTGIVKSLYEDDKIRLERTQNHQGAVWIDEEEQGQMVHKFDHYSDSADTHVNTITPGYIFRCWYWEDANGNKTYLSEGETNSDDHVDNRLDVLLPEEATKVGADYVATTTRTITFVSNAHGSYNVKADTYNTSRATVTPSVAADSDPVAVNNLLMNAPITLSNPVAATGYAFSRWYYTTSNGIKKTLASQSEEITVLLPEGTTTVGAEFVQMGDFSVSGLYFTTLTDAIQAAQSEVKNGAETSTIIVARDATLPAGNYTIPAKVVLLIPYKAEQYTSGPVDRIETTAVPDKDHAYRKLTLANGAHLEVYGTIEVSGCQTTAQQRDVEISRPGGSGASYGLMQMDNGSSITLNDKSQLNAWGFIQGTGTIDARRGSSVREQFQINDWKTLITTCRMAAGGSINYQLHVLPINQYFIQNIEVKTTYHPGSRLFGQVSANVIGMKLAFNDVGIIGVKYSDKEKADALEQQHILLKDDVAVFLMDNADNSEDTWVCKWYDVENDQQVYDVNNSAYLGSLAMEINFAANGINIDLSAFGYGDIEGIDVDSRDFALPLSNNFKIHLKSGNLVITQNTILLPGAVIEIDKKSTMTIVDEVRNKQTGELEQDKPQTLYLYDANQWGRYVTAGVNDGGAFTTIFDAFNNYDLLFGYGSRVKFRPGGVPNVRDISSPAGLGDAQLIVHGTVDVKGYLKTTYGDKNVTYVDNKYTYTNTTPSQTEGGAITSRVEDAGTIIFSRQAQSLAQTSTDNRDNFLWQVDEAKTDDYVHYVGNHIIPAWLKNEAGSSYSGGDGYTETANAEAGKSFCFIDIDGDNKGEWVSLTNDGCFVKDDYDTYYAKPKEYVALANGKTANADHTYSDAAGQGRLFILVDDCQWWEVQKKDNLYHCIHPDNDTYYYWGYDYLQDKDRWMEKVFQITWVNWDGSSLKWDGTTEDTKYQNHVIYNLNYGIIPKYLEDGNPTRPDDVDYTYNFVGWTPEIDSVKGDATYTAVYEKIQKKYTIIFNDQNGNEIERQQLALGANPEPPTISNPLAYWDPAIATVSGNTTYTLMTYDEEPEEFTITWRNYDGSEIYHETVESGVKPSYSGVPPVKNLNNEYNYTFSAWSPTIVNASANAAYTATFSAEAKGFDIKFYDVNGDQIGSTQHLAYGATPVAPEYSKAATAQYTYSLRWYDVDNASEEEATTNIPTVTRAANYKAYFAETLNKYTVTLMSETDTACTFVGAGLYDYNAADDALTIRVNPNVGYKFVKWQVFDGDEYEDTDKARSFTTAITADMTYRAIVEPQTDLVVDVTDVTDVKKPQEVDNLILSSNGSESGQLLHSDRLTVTGNCYFDLAINAKNHQWYAVAVPWQVDAQTGISVNGKTLELGKDFDIIYYDGARRASEGKQKCWKYVEDDDNKTLVPGRLYMIGLMGDAQVIRFAKKAGAAILTTSTSVTAYAQTTGVNSDAGWNGVANPALFHAFVNPGTGEHPITDGQVYNPDSKSYSLITLNDTKFVVGQGAFVSVKEDKAITVTSGGAFAAPRRTREQVNLKYDVRIAPAEAKYTDRLFIKTTDDKETDEYIVGQDLAKIGVSSIVPQMWINRYNEKLCVNTQELQNEKAEYPLGISVPANGEYTISNVNDNEDYTLYLTLNNEAIWNLSDAPYTLDLTKGTTNAYGLRISAKAPQVVTGVDEAVVDAKGETRKVLINNQVFIIRGNEVYSIDGQLIR